MAAHLSSSTTTTAHDERQQASPLPTKRGEIGYQEDVHGQVERQQSSDSPPVALPLRHPADRDPPPPTSVSLSVPSDDPVPSSASPLVTTTNVNRPDTSSTHSCDKPSFISFFRIGKSPVYFGVCLTTLIFLGLHVFFIGGTIAIWVTSAIRFNKDMSEQPSYDKSVSLGVFIHVIFSILIIGQLIFFERRIFQLRAERFMHLHPSDSLPTSAQRQSLSGNTHMPLAPWNRPPLPTYAATLAQSGFGTGDVEDHLIAAPPPPAYGNTRGSTLVLAGFLRDSLRAQQQRPGSVTSERIPRERPVSYRTTDEEWEAICDAERARRLEETLASLERPQTRSRRTETA